MYLWSYMQTMVLISIFDKLKNKVIQLLISHKKVKVL